MKRMDTTSKAFIVAGVLLFVFTLVSPGKAQSATPCLEWNLATDFRVFPDEENPNRDSCGNLDVWHFLESDPNTFPAHIPSTYTLLPGFETDSFSILGVLILGMEQWQGSAVFPWVGINNTGSTQSIPGSGGFIVWPPGVIGVHPLPNEFAIVGWRSPFNGTVTVTGGVNDLHSACGNGILWFIDRFDGFTNTILASGSISSGGSQDFQDGVGGASLASVIVNQGDFLYFLVDPNSNNHSCDSTRLTVIIRRTTIGVSIDIKPGSFPNRINPKNKGVIPVAILTTATFDATTVDPTTVRFGPTGTEAVPMQSALEDVDGDGDTDMILYFKTQDTGFVCGDTSASLTGETLSGQPIEGSDSIKTAGCK